MKKLIILLLFSISPLISQISPIPSAQEKEAPPIPNPVDLKAGWWDYFDVKADLFETKKEEFKKNTDKLISSMPPEIVLKAKDELQKIYSNLDVLLDVKKESLPAIIKKSEDYNENYNLEAFSDLGLKNYEVQKKINTYELQISLEEKSISINEKDLDNQFVNYLSLDNQTEEKFFLGLKIISSKINLEIDHHHLNLLKNQKERVKIDKEQILKEIEYARNHLNFSKETKDQIEQSLIEEKKKAKNFESQVNEIQYEIFQKKPKPLKNIEDNTLLQNLLFTRVNLAISRITVINLKIKKAFTHLNLSPDDTNLNQLHENLQIWIAEKHEIEKELSNWQQEAKIRIQTTFNLLSEKRNERKITEIIQLANDTFLAINTLEKKFFLSSFLTDQFSLLLKEKYITFKDRITHYWHQFIGFFKTHAKWFNQSFFKIGKTPITPFGILKFLIILTVSFLLAFFIKKWLRSFSQKHHHLSQSGIYTLSRLSFYVIIFLGFLIAVYSVGIDFTAFAVVAGVIGIGIGFGLQSIFNNFIAGIIVLLEKNIRIGDLIKIDSGEIGIIQAINVRTTIIKTFDNIEILIPNSDLVLKKFDNWTLSEKTRRVSIPFCVSNETDLDKLKKVCIEVAKKVPTTIPDKEPDLWVSSFGDSCINAELVVWVNEFIPNIPVMSANSRYLIPLKKAFEENDIHLPYPTRRIFLHEKNHKQEDQ